MVLVRLLFGVNGRIGRATLWLVVLIWAVTVAVAIGGTLLIAPLDAALGAGALVMLVAFASSISLGIRRLHDRNKTPLWLLLFYGVPIALHYIISPMTDGIDPSSHGLIVTFLQYVWLAVVIWALVELGVLRGTIGPNPHGPDPIAPKPAPERPAH